MRCLLFFLGILPLFAMPQAPLRVEINLPRADGNYYVVPVGKLGVVLFYENAEDRNKGKCMFTFVRYDTDFREVWSRNFLVSPGLEFCKYDLDGDHLYIFLTGSKKQTSFEIVNLGISGGDILSSAGIVPSKTQFEDFIVVNGTAYFGGRTLPSEGTIFARTCLTYALCCIPAFFGGFEFKYQPVLYTADISNGSRAAPVVLKYSGSAGLTDLAKNMYTGNAEAVVLHRPGKDAFNLEVKEFSGSEISGSLRVSPGGKNELIYGRVNVTEEKGKLVIGTYGFPIKYKSFNERLARASGKTSAFTTANGIFISKFSEGEQEYIQYYPFSKFQSFWDGTREQHPDKSNDPRSEGRVGYSLLLHNIIEMNNEYIMVAEAYYPEYETRTEYYFDPNGNYVPRTSQVFAGYRYTHAMIAAFGKDGEKLWDNSFEIMDILTFNLKERVKVLFEGDNVVLAYSVGGMIKSKVISGNQVVDGKQTTEIGTNFPDDIVRSSWGSDMEFWYDNFFLTWGFQRIKNSERPGSGSGNKRTVFYFNKIEFQ